jgi:XTP/dITP diphosphohydrolase
MAARPGERLLEVVRIIDVLLSPGGDAWKRAQTHASLARFLLEEAYEAYDAIESGNLDAVRDELGDVLLQVVLHARLAEQAQPPWNIDDVADTLAAKLIRRNPHVFPGGMAHPAGDGPGELSIEEITAAWDRIKKEEKPRSSVLDGVPLQMPALALAAKVVRRAKLTSDIQVPEFADEDALGELLLAIVVQATGEGLDAEGALRRIALKRAADHDQ